MNNHIYPPQHRVFALCCLAFVTVICGQAFAKMLQTPPPSKTEQATPLKTAFEGKFLIGAVLNYPALQGKAPEKVAMVQRHFNALTAENSLKPAFTQPTEGKFQFAEGDKLVEIAKGCNATVVGHALVWHSQTPEWFFKTADGSPLSRELALERMNKHISTVVGHFKGRIKEWDVVNEALSDNSQEYLRPSPWLKAIGTDYIEAAFRAAHKADPDAILIYNDYNIERNYKRASAVRLLKELLARGTPIHAVGMQCHLRLDSPDLAEIEESIKQFSALGLKVMITELDMSVLPSRYEGADLSAVNTASPEAQKAVNPYVSKLPEEVAKQQAERYSKLFELFLRHKKSIGRVTLWGVQDGDSWLNNFPMRGRTDYPLLFDRQGNPKPAFNAVLNAARRDPN